MATTIPTTEPTEFISGERVQWKKSLPDYPATGYTLSYDFANASGAFTESTSTADGNDHLVTIAAADAPTAGVYSWQAWIVNDSDATEVLVVATGTVEVKAALDGATAYDNRSWAAKALDDIEAAIAAHLAGSPLRSSYSIAGRSMTFDSFESMLAARSRLRAEVDREIEAERIANGLESKAKIRARF